MNPDIMCPDGKIASQESESAPEIATRNACKLCAPLGAALVFKGIKGCLPFLHGSQGCATYIRRYLISHFREPVDIASSSFSEDDAIFGGARNFKEGLNNVAQQYHPDLIGVATTCLAETIGENMLGMIREYQETQPTGSPPLVHVSTPAYAGTHSDGFYATLTAVVKSLVAKAGRPIDENRKVNLLPAMMSCADLRYLREICEGYGLNPTLLPDYSDTLEGGSWDAYHRIPPGGTSLEAISGMGSAHATLEFGHTLATRTDTAGSFLEKEHGVFRRALGWPLGIRLNDTFFTTLSEISGQTMPHSFRAERSRLIDAYVDAHKYVSGRRVAIYGEPDLVIALAAFLSEIGMTPVICATGSRIKGWRELLEAEIEGGTQNLEALTGADHSKISALARELKPDLLVGSSKGYPLAREMGMPLLRVGFPIHDRIGAQRELTVGYRGTQHLFDRVVNALLELRQDQSSTGYSYL